MLRPVTLAEAYLLGNHRGSRFGAGELDPYRGACWAEDASPSVDVQTFAPGSHPARIPANSPCADAPWPREPLRHGLMRVLVQGADSSVCSALLVVRVPLLRFLARSILLLAIAPLAARIAAHACADLRALGKAQCRGL